MVVVVPVATGRKHEGEVTHGRAGASSGSSGCRAAPHSGDPVPRRKTRPPACCAQSGAGSPLFTGDGAPERRTTGSIPARPAFNEALGLLAAGVIASVGIGLVILWRRWRPRRRVISKPGSLFNTYAN